MGNSILIIANERVGLETCRQLLIKKYNIKAIFTSHPSRREKIADFADFSPIASEYPNIPIHHIINPKEPLVIEKIKSYNPDLIIVVSWSQIIPRDILSIPTFGTVGVHYSLLPRRRGGAPFTWAIIDGLSKTGLTLFYYNEGIDTGNIIDQVEIEIGDHETIKDLLDKTMTLLPNLLLKNIDSILSGKCNSYPQNESEATYFPSRTPADGEIDWDQPVKKIYDFIRAQTNPYPCAFTKATYGNGKYVKIQIPSSKITDGILIIEGIVIK